MPTPVAPPPTMSMSHGSVWVRARVSICWRSMGLGSRRPAAGAGESFIPSSKQSLRLRPRHAGFESLLSALEGVDVLNVSPNSGAQARQVCGSEGCAFRHRRADHRNAEDIGLKLHEGVVGSSAAIDAEFAQSGARVALSGGEQVSHLVGNTLKRRASDVSGGRSTGEA